MCYICRCFGWALDLLQRIITFIFACIICCAICIGMTLAIAAGVAYGYNFSLAEFVDFTRSDVTVFVRRGQFGDHPEIGPHRRAGDDDNFLFSSNFSLDYQEGQKDSIESKPLSDAWQRAQDSRNYAERLTKYSKIKSAHMRSGTVDEDEVAAMNVSGRKEVDDEPNRPTLSSPMFYEPPPRRSLDLDDPLLHDHSMVHNMITPQNYESNDVSELEGGGHRFKKHRHKNGKQKRPNVNLEILDTSRNKSLHLHTEATISPPEYLEDVEYSNIFKPV